VPAPASGGVGPFLTYKGPADAALIKHAALIERVGAELTEFVGAALYKLVGTAQTELVDACKYALGRLAGRAPPTIWFFSRVLKADYPEGLQNSHFLHNHLNFCS
jgi:hypothetical protein